MADLTVGLAEKVDAVASGPFRDVRFTRDQLQEIRYASLLHDFGKVGVREKVLIKGKKLYVGEMTLIRQRFAYIKRTLEAEHLRAKLDARRCRGTADGVSSSRWTPPTRSAPEVDQILRTVLQANEPTILEEESFRALMDLPARTFGDSAAEDQLSLDEGPTVPTSAERGGRALDPRGSLSDKERREIESHVTHTSEFLSEIPWTGEYRGVPKIAYAHHEKLDGTGYPRQLTAPRHPDPVADDDDLRHLRRAGGLGPAVQEVGAGGQGPRHPERTRRGTGSSTADLLDVFVDAKVYDAHVARIPRRPRQ